jgi:hypothetical protein
VLSLPLIGLWQRGGDGLTARAAIVIPVVLVNSHVILLKLPNWTLYG